jgi:hypothetical protein
MMTSKVGTCCCSKNLVVSTISYMTTGLINTTGCPNLTPFTVCQIQEDHNLYCGLLVQLNIHIYKTSLVSVNLHYGLNSTKSMYTKPKNIFSDVFPNHKCLDQGDVLPLVSHCSFIPEIANHMLTGTEVPLEACQYLKTFIIIS